MHKHKFITKWNQNTYSASKGS